MLIDLFLFCCWRNARRRGCCVCILLVDTDIADSRGGRRYRGGHGRGSTIKHCIRHIRLKDVVSSWHYRRRHRSSRKGHSQSTVAEDWRGSSTSHRKRRLRWETIRLRTKRGGYCKGRLLHLNRKRIHCSIDGTRIRDGRRRRHGGCCRCQQCRFWWPLLLDKSSISSFYSNRGRINIQKAGNDLLCCLFIGSGVFVFRVSTRNWSSNDTYPFSFIRSVFRLARFYSSLMTTWRGKDKLHCAQGSQ